MGIRYYAFAFDADMTDQAVADPRRFLSPDPLADAWGIVRADTGDIATFQQAIPEEEMLYLDKAWRLLQSVTGAPPGHPARPAFQMFEGEVHPGYGPYDAWVRAHTPEQVIAISRDLNAITEDEIRTRLADGDGLAGESAVTYAIHYLQEARRFADSLASNGRGFVHMIG